MSPHVTPLRAITLHPSGWARISPTREITCLPLIDSATTIAPCGTGPQLFARAIQPSLEVFATSVGARLPTREDILALFHIAEIDRRVLAPHIQTPDAHMGDLDRCRTHDAAVMADLGEPKLGQCWANIGKHPIVPHAPHRMRLFGWRKPDGTWWQPGFQDVHTEDQTDYATLCYLVRDVGAVIPDVTTELLSSYPDNPRPAVRTPCTYRALFDALTEAIALANLQGDRDVLRRALVCQSAIETAKWRSCWNNNFGNVKAKKARPWMMLNGVKELINGVWRTFQPPHPQTHFSAFDSLTQAAGAWVDFLVRKYPKSLAIALSGSAEGYARKLHDEGYYTAEPDDYAAALMAEYRQLDGNLLDVEAALRSLGYPDASPASVKAFQRSQKKLGVDGIAGPMTRAALVAATARGVG